MPIRRILALLLISLLLTSCAFLGNLAINNHEYLHPTSVPRFLSLILIHFVLVCYVVIFLGVADWEEAGRWALLMFANIAATVTMTELYIYRDRKGYSSHDAVAFTDPQELIYLNLYFLLYSLSLLASFILSIVNITLACIECARVRRIRTCLQNNVKTVPYLP